jgi:enolase-phosphatase E1
LPESLLPATTRAIVLDIEGTTTPIAFVHDVLFPYANERLPAVLQARHEESQFAELIAEAARIEGLPGLDVASAIRLFLDWSLADRKVAPLKTLQGLIWQEGYLDGSLRSPVYADVAPALRRWRDRGIELYVYSSGSVAAQKLLFGHTLEGDLTGSLSGYFDTTVGAKTDAASYERIQQRIGRPATELLFFSDNILEIAAARTARWQAVLVERDGPVPGRVPPAVTSFAEV